MYTIGRVVAASMISWIHKAFVPNPADK